jgi:Arc/MetJ-type ribon-helix-helix transcriptional regulator/anti-sigma regulatory factor (Ser/Thr protein kinase)
VNATTTADFGAELLAVPKAVPELRRAVREWFGEDAYGRVGGDIQLCVTELVGNVLRHVGEGTPVSVRVGCVGGARIRVAVSDPDPRALPVLLSATGADESGRGLALLGALAVRWGMEVRGVGKTVWCEMAGDRPGAERGGMVIGMATKKYTVTLPEALAEEIRSEVGPGEFSAYVTRAIERQREQDRLGELVAWLEEEHGPVTEAELAAAEAERREIDRIFAEREAAAEAQYPKAS